PRYATNGKRVENRVELTRILDELFAGRTTRDWVEALEAAGVPNGPINTIEQVFAEPQAIARGLRLELAHPAAGKVSLVRSPMWFSGTPIEHERPPPLLGEHTDEVLGGLLAMKDDEIAKLRADGAI
ncbi:MAG: CoA transferase, partial [Burkholderiales bacterium]